MSFTYNYTITTDLYGGFFNANTSTILSLLSSKLIPDVNLINISADLGIMSLEYARELTPTEKTTLDNNQVGPCGGIIGRCNDHIELVYPSPFPPGVFLETAAEMAEDPYPEPEAFDDMLYIASDGKTYCELLFRYIRGDGVHTAGYGNSVELIPDGGAGPITLDFGLLNNNGEFSTIMGPTFWCGRLNYRVWSSFLPIISFAIRFSGEAAI